MKIALSRDPACLDGGANLGIAALRIGVAGIGEIVKQDQATGRHNPLEDGEVVIHPGFAVVAVNERDGGPHLRIGTSEGADGPVNEHDPLDEVTGSGLGSSHNEAASVDIQRVDDVFMAGIVQCERHQYRGLASIGADLKDRS